MKRRYQIDQQRAVQQFRRLAREENPNIQMICKRPKCTVLLSVHESVKWTLRQEWSRCSRATTPRCG
jgi:hypothetical protein